jgi:hypothetical protein
MSAFVALPLPPQPAMVMATAAVARRMEVVRLMVGPAG